MDRFPLLVPQSAQSAILKVIVQLPCIIKSSAHNLNHIALAANQKLEVFLPNCCGLLKYRVKGLAYKLAVFIQVCPWRCSRNGKQLDKQAENGIQVIRRFTSSRTGLLSRTLPLQSEVNQTLSPLVFFCTHTHTHTTPRCTCARGRERDRREGSQQPPFPEPSLPTCLLRTYRTTASHNSGYMLQ